MKKDNRTKVEKKSPIIVDGWCAFNVMDYPNIPIDEISFEKTESIARKNWGRYDQSIKRCKVMIYVEE